MLVIMYNTDMYVYLHNTYNDHQSATGLDRPCDRAQKSNLMAWVNASNLQATRVCYTYYVY
jgi:hypothetical protein